MAGEVYWLVISTTATSVSLYGYDGSQLGGDPIQPGNAWSTNTAGGWTAAPTADIHIVVNPCQ